MSTKIYSGYALPLMDVSKLISFCKEVQNIFIEVRRQELTRLFTPEDYKKNWSKLQDSVWEEERKRLRHFLDFSADAVFFQDRDKILAITYWEHRQFTEAWSSLPNVAFYGWWNNTDAEDGVSEKDWEERRLAWERVLLSFNGIPAQNGLAFEFLNSTLPFPWEWGTGSGD